MKNIILLLTFLVLSLSMKAQGTTDLSNPTTSVVDPVESIGSTGFVEVQLSNTFVPIPANGVRLEITITNHLNITPILVDNFGVWGVTYNGTENGNTVIVVKNTLAAMPILSNYELRFNFIAVNLSCVDCGIVNSNVGLTDDAIGVSDVPPTNNGANAKYTVSIPLPIKLGDFATKINDCSSIDVFWNTYSEENFEKAEIQKSVDGKNYISIGTVKTKGNGTAVNNSYLFTDNSPLVSGTVYYRLKVIDLDKSYSYSRVATAIVNCDNAIDMDIYPNPTYGQANVSFSGFKTNNMREVLILNVKGDVVRSIKMDPLANNNLNVNDLVSGIYFLKLVDETHVIQKKFVKIN